MRNSNLSLCLSLSPSHFSLYLPSPTSPILSYPPAHYYELLEMITGAFHLDYEFAGLTVTLSL